MSRTVDERVVSMEFDNKRFESNVQTSLGTIEKLKQSLKFKGVSDSLRDVNKSISKTDFSPLSNAAHSVGLKFSAMYTIADQAFRNITNSAIAAGKRVASAFTITPVKTGMNEYELKMGSIQTIMASTGESLDTVNQYLNELNTYSDQTIYSFQDMTSNIGKFTNAGVKLEDAVLAIKGVSNEAAVSGANANEASRAMYNFAQALSSGYVKLIDWKSIENANMATVEFKNQLIATAVELGTVKKSADGMYKTLDGNAFNATKNFNEVLQDQWMTSEVLIKTLKNYADETTDIGKKAKAAATEIKTFSMLMDTLKESVQSGWAQTWELIIGDFEEAKALWTKVGEVLGGIIDKTAKARNELLGGALDSKFDKLTKRINDAGVSTVKFEEEVKKVLDSQGRDYDGFIKRYGSLEKAVQAGAISSKTLQTAIGNLSKTISSADLNLVDKILGRGNKGDQVKQIQQALVDLGYDIGEQFGVDGIIGKYTEEAIKQFQKDNGLEVTGIVDDKTLAALKKATEGAVDLGNSIDDIMDGVDQLGGRQLLFESFGNIFKGLGQILGTVRDGFRDIFPKMTSERLYELIQKFHELTSKFKLSEKTTIRLRKVFRGLFAAVDIVWQVIKSVGKAISAVFGGNLVKKAGSGVLGFASKIGDLITRFRGWLIENDRLTNAFTKLFGGIKKVVGKVVDWIVSLKDLPFVTNLVDKFKEKWQSLEGATPFDKIATIFKKLGSTIKGAFNKVKEFIKGFKDLPGVQENLDKFKTEFKKIKDTLKGKWSTGLEKIKEWIQSIKEMDGLSFKNIKKAFVDFKDNVLGHFFKNEDGTSIFGGLFEAIKNLKDKAKEYLESAGISFDKGKNKILDFFNGIKEFFGSNWGKILGVTTVLAGLIGIIYMVKKTVGVFQTIVSPLATLEEISETFKGLAKSMKAKLATDSIKSIAIAIGILAASVFLLSKADQTYMWSAIGAIVVLVGVLTAMTLLIGKKVKTKTLTEMAKVMLSIGGAMLMIAGVAKILASMSWGDLAKGGAGIAVFLGMIVGVMSATKLIGHRNMDNFGKMMLKLSGALLILAIVAKIFGKMDTGVLIKGGIAVAAFMGLMVGVMVLTKFMGSNVAQFGKCMLSMSAGLLILALVVKIFGKMDTGVLIKGGVAVAAFMGLMVAMMTITKLFGNSSGDLAKFGTMMLGFSAALLVMTASVAILGSMKVSTLVKGIAAIAALGLVIAGFMALSKFAGKADFKTLMGMALSIAILAGAIALLTLVDTTKMVAATAALTVVMAVFAGLAMSTKMMNTKSIGALLVLAGIVALIAGVFVLLSKLQIESVLGIATGLSATMLAVAGTCAIISRVPVVGALKGILALAIVIAGMGLIMAAISGLMELFPNMNDFLTNAIPVLGSIGTGLGTFVGSIIGSFGESIAASLPNIATSLSDFATNLQPFIDTVSGLDANLLVSIGNLTGALAAITAASVLDSIFSWVTGGSSITSFCEQLVPFGTAMVNFSSTVSGKIDEGAVTAAANAGLIMAEMAKEIPNSGGILGGIMGNNDIDDFGTKLESFGSSIMRFSSIVSGGEINETAVKAAANAGLIMTEMSKEIPNSGGILGIIMGNNDMDDFGNMLVSFGWSIRRFSAVVSGGEINEDAIAAAANAGTLMTKMADTIPNSNGIVSWFVGNNDLDDFAAKLVPFGWAIRRFSAVVSGGEINEDAIAAAANAGTMMTKMADTIPNSKGVVSWFVGNNDLDDFAAKLVPFGWAIRRFSAVVSGGEINEDAVQAAANAGTVLANLESALPETSGFMGWLTGKQDLGDFGTNISNFGTGIKGFSDAVTGLDTTAVSAATTAATDLLTLSQGIADSEKTKNLATFGGNLESLGWSLAGFSDYIADVNTVKMATVVRHLTNLAAVDLSGIESLGTSLSTLGTTSLDEFLDSFENSDTKFKNAGIKLITSVGKGLSSKLISLKLGVTTMMTAIVQTINNTSDSFKAAGKNVVAGFAKGITNTTWKAQAAARQMGKATLEAAKKALKIQSPSREFYSVGDFAGQGFVNALSDYESISYKAGGNMADSARSGLSKAIGKVRDILSSDVDAQPTIRPVLDLSDVANGAGSINRMLSMNPSVGVMANVGAINSTMGRIQGGTSNDDVVSAIKDLGSKLGKTAGDTYSVNGITYDDGSAVSDAVKSIVRAAQIERRR